MAMTQRTWTLLGVVAGILLAALTYLVGVAPTRSHTASLKTQTTDARDANELLVIKTNALRTASLKIDSLRDTLTTERDALPETSDLASFTRDLNRLAATNNVSVKSIGFSAPTVATLGAGTTSGAVAGSAAGQLFVIPISLVADGLAPQELSLIKQLREDEGRAVLVGDVQLAAAPHTTTLTVSMKIFVAPKSQAAIDALNKELGGSTAK